jgi:hypothetical protein
VAVTMCMSLWCLVSFFSSPAAVSAMYANIAVSRVPAVHRQFVLPAGASPPHLTSQAQHRLVSVTITAVNCIADTRYTSVVLVYPVSSVQIIHQIYIKRGSRLLMRHCCNTSTECVLRFFVGYIDSRSTHACRP